MDVRKYHSETYFINISTVNSIKRKNDRIEVNRIIFDYRFLAIIILEMKITFLCVYKS